jgi:hypothetical protein
MSREKGGAKSDDEQKRTWIAIAVIQRHLVVRAQRHRTALSIRALPKSNSASPSGSHWAARMKLTMKSAVWPWPRRSCSSALSVHTYIHPYMPPSMTTSHDQAHAANLSNRDPCVRHILGMGSVRTWRGASRTGGIPA